MCEEGDGRGTCGGRRRGESEIEYWNAWEENGVRVRRSVIVRVCMNDCVEIAVILLGVVTLVFLRRVDEEILVSVL